MQRKILKDISEKQTNMSGLKEKKGLEEEKQLELDLVERRYDKDLITLTRKIKEEQQRLNCLNHQVENLEHSSAFKGIREEIKELSQERDSKLIKLQKFKDQEDVIEVQESTLQKQVTKYEKDLKMYDQDKIYITSLIGLSQRSDMLALEGRKLKGLIKELPLFVKEISGQQINKQIKKMKEKLQKSEELSELDAKIQKFNAQRELLIQNKQKLQLMLKQPKLNHSSVYQEEIKDFVKTMKYNPKFVQEIESLQKGSKRCIGCGQENVKIDLKKIKEKMKKKRQQNQKEYLPSEQFIQCLEQQIHGFDRQATEVEFDDICKRQKIIIIELEDLEKRKEELIESNLLVQQKLEKYEEIKDLLTKQKKNAAQFQNVQKQIQELEGNIKGSIRDEEDLNTATRGLQKARQNLKISKECRAKIKDKILILGANLNKIADRIELNQDKLRAAKETYEIDGIKSKIKESRKNLEQLKEKEINQREQISQFKQEKEHVFNKIKNYDKQLAQAQSAIRKREPWLKLIHRLNEAYQELRGQAQVQKGLDKVLREKDTARISLLKIQAQLSTLNKVKEDPQKIQVAQKLKDQYQNLKLHQEQLHLNLNRIKQKKSKLQEEQKTYLKSTKDRDGKQKGLEEKSKQKLVQIFKQPLACAHEEDISLNFQIKVLENVVKDLERKIQVIKRSVIEFHGKKLKDINRTLNILWKSVYKGSEIKEVNITYNLDNQRTKNYDYHVEMVKESGARLNMRSEASGGQRMLVSILIRLAISEVLCEECGFLALDEPTVHLDVAHKAELADMLGHFVEMREAKGKFQLIIISHDVGFLERLGARISEEYWLVKKSKEGSVLQREALLK